MITPRYYQEEAIDAVFDYWSNGGGNPLVDQATGTGKSLSLAMLFKRPCDGMGRHARLCAQRMLLSLWKAITKSF